MQLVFVIYLLKNKTECNDFPASGLQRLLNHECLKSVNFQNKSSSAIRNTIQEIGQS